jgi:hypothetical protein
MRLTGKLRVVGNYRENAMRLIDPADFEGVQKIRMLVNIVAGGKPRARGEVIELPSYAAYELVCAGLAEPFIEAPRLTLL